MNESMLIGLAGQARSGKDTVAAHLCSVHGMASMAFADPLKDAIAAMLGVARETLDMYPKEVELPFFSATPRRLYQTLGTEWGRDMINPDMWVRLMHQRSRTQRPEGVGLVVTDVRMPNEADWVRREGGTVIHVCRIDREPVRAHVSEQILPLSPGDMWLPNNGTIDELYKRTDDLVRLMVSRQ